MSSTGVDQGSDRPFPELLKGKGHLDPTELATSQGLWPWRAARVRLGAQSYLDRSYQGYTPWVSPKSRSKILMNLLCPLHSHGLYHNQLRWSLESFEVSDRLGIKLISKFNVRLGLVHVQDIE